MGDIGPVRNRYEVLALHDRKDPRERRSTGPTTAPTWRIPDPDPMPVPAPEPVPDPSAPAPDPVPQPPSTR